MLGLLAFKKSLFTGVLDDGQDEVFLGGTRLKKFVESVEKATGEIPPSMPRQPEPEPNGRIAEPPSATQAPGSEPEQGWNDVLAAGVSLLEKLGKTLAANPKDSAGKLPAGLVARDENTGQSYLKLPLPDADTMRKITDLLSIFGGRDT